VKSHYRSAPERWLVEMWEAICQHRIVLDDTIRKAVEIHHDEEIIKVVSGLTLPQFHSFVGRAGLRILFGPEAIPEFGTPRPRLALVQNFPPRLPEPVMPLIPAQRSLSDSPEDIVLDSTTLFGGM
jgi:hypothetical protein